MAKKKSRLKIVLFGCQQIAVDFIEFLSSQDVELSLVITYELPLDKTYGYSSVSETCAKLGIDYEKPSRVTDRIFQKIVEIKPDMIFSVYYRKILPTKILNIPQLGCINIHPSILPYYRGPVPTAWAILNGEKEFGITIHQMDKEIDTGVIFVQKKYKINDDETGFELYNRGMKLGAKLLEENFYNLLNGSIQPKPQKGIGSYYGKRKGISRIDWQQNTETIRNLIRVHARPYNPAETKILNRYVIINKASRTSLPSYKCQGPGVIVGITPDKKIIVSCADGLLRLDEYEIFPTLQENEQDIYLRVGNKFEF